jgi:hypothetical protein
MHQHDFMSYLPNGNFCCMMMCVIVICLIKDWVHCILTCFTRDYSQCSGLPLYFSNCKTSPFLDNGAEGPEPENDIHGAHGVVTPRDSDPWHAYHGDRQPFFYFS